jgi:hypothetical protein
MATGGERCRIPFMFAFSPYSYIHPSMVPETVRSADGEVGEVQRDQNTDSSLQEFATHPDDQFTAGVTASEPFPPYGRADKKRRRFIRLRRNPGNVGGRDRLGAEVTAWTFRSRLCQETVINRRLVRLITTVTPCVRNARPPLNGWCFLVGVTGRPPGM